MRAHRDGNDGSWSTFWISIGTPPQTVRLLPSTTGNAVWPVLSEGCTQQDPSNCSEARGEIYHPESSTSYSDIGLFELGLLEESALGYSGNGSFGYDDIIMGMSSASSPTVTHQVVEGFATKDFYLGTIGLSPHPINISSFSNSTNSLLSSLKEQNSIPSLSWAYTAGASYAQPPAFGSLILGGYDSSGFEPHNVTFKFGPDRNRELLVFLANVDSSLFHSAVDVGVYALLDSLVPDLWLPENICRNFETSFGLNFNSSLNRYFVNDTTHQTLLKSDITVSLTLGGGSSGEGAVNITLPYASFDLVDNAPGIGTADQGTRYFPLRQAANTAQYTLGRAFFQNAYVIADFERSNFSVYQAVSAGFNTVQSLVPILPPSTNATQGKGSPQSGHGGLNQGMLIAVVVPVAVVSLAAGSILIWMWRRMKKLRKAPEESQPSQDELQKPELDGRDDFFKAELSEESQVDGPELEGQDIVELFGGVAGHEVPGGQKTAPSELLGNDRIFYEMQ